MMIKKPIYIFISGGVISGLGKGVTTASLGLLLKSAGYKVSVMKIDMYLNQDAGTMNPIEHGEVFVTDDGLETDEDLGHYERFLNQDLGRKNYLTAGMIYKLVLEKERRMEYQGRCIDAYYEIPQDVIKKLEEAAAGQDFFLVELGGTVGEYQNILFFEAARRLKIKHPGQVFFVHVVYLPIPPSLGEMKSKPAQQSISALNSLGIFPDFLVCRAEEAVDERRKEKIALSAALPKDRIFSAPDMDSIYKVPLVLKRQKMLETILKVVGLKYKEKDLVEWQKRVKLADLAEKTVKIGIVGKYYQSGGFCLEDSYVCVAEAVKHAAWYLGRKPEIVWLNSEDLEKGTNPKMFFQGIQGIIVPGGFGSRGVEGKILAVKYARENKIPYLGLCYGMQMATIEFARNVLGRRGANTTEVDAKTQYPVIHLMSEQEKKMLARDYGGTMRLGSWEGKLKGGTISAECYQGKIIHERHRHRYEFNNQFKEAFEKAGIVIAGTTPDNKIVEIIELPKNVHPFFVGVQFHPEFKSRFLKPHPLFLGLIKSVIVSENER